jgi:Uma2 family endonuclease
MTWVNTSPFVKTYTLEEFWELPESPDRLKLELIAGVLYMTPPPGYKHDNAASKLNRLMSAHLIASDTKGTIYFPRAAIWRTPNTYLEPDLFYVSAETAATMRADYRTTADIVIEVISPGSAIYDRNTKADTYAALGVKELWLIDEAFQIVEMRTLEEGKYFSSKPAAEDDLVESKVLTGFRFKVSELFKDQF